MSSTDTLVDFLRHGHCEGGEIFRGRTDVPLSETGWAQLREKAGDNLGHWDHIISSPLQRCRTFAEECSRTWGIPVTIDERWSEISFGDWDGQLVSDVWSRSKAEVLSYFADPENNNTANIEPITQVANRALESWNDLLASHRGKRLLVVCHGGIIRIHLASLLGLDLKHISRLNVPYASLNRINAKDTDREPKIILDFMNGQP